MDDPDLDTDDKMAVDTRAPHAPPVQPQQRRQPPPPPPPLQQRQQGPPRSSFHIAAGVANGVNEPPPGATVPAKNNVFLVALCRELLAQLAQEPHVLPERVADLVRRTEQRRPTQKFIRQLLREHHVTAETGSWPRALRHGVSAVVDLCRRASEDECTRLLPQLRAALPSWAAFDVARGESPRDALLREVESRLSADDFASFLYITTAKLGKTNLIAQYVCVGGTKTTARILPPLSPAADPNNVANVAVAMHRNALALALDLCAVIGRAVGEAGGAKRLAASAVAQTAVRVARIGWRRRVASDPPATSATQFRSKDYSTLRLAPARSDEQQSMSLKQAEQEGKNQAAREQLLTRRVAEAIDAHVVQLDLVRDDHCSLLSNEAVQLQIEVNVLFGEHVNRVGAVLGALLRSLLGLMGVPHGAAAVKFGALLANLFSRHSLFSLPSVFLPLARLLDRVQDWTEERLRVLLGGIQCVSVLLHYGARDVPRSRHKSKLGDLLITSDQSARVSFAHAVSLLVQYVRAKLDVTDSAPKRPPTAAPVGKRRRSARASTAAAVASADDAAADDVPAVSPEPLADPGELDDELLDARDDDSDVADAIVALHSLVATLASAEEMQDDSAQLVAAVASAMPTLGVAVGAPLTDVVAAARGTIQALQGASTPALRALAAAVVVECEGFERTVFDNDYLPDDASVALYSWQDAAAAFNMLLGAGNARMTLTPAVECAVVAIVELAKTTLAMTANTGVAMRAAQLNNAKVRNQTQRTTLESSVQARSDVTQHSDDAAKAKKKSLSNDEHVRRADYWAPLYALCTDKLNNLPLLQVCERFAGGDVGVVRVRSFIVTAKPRSWAPLIDQQRDHYAPIYRQTLKERAASGLGSPSVAVAAHWATLAALPDPLFMFLAVGAAPVQSQVHRDDSSGAVLLDAHGAAVGRRVNVFKAVQVSTDGTVHQQTMRLRDGIKLLCTFMILHECFLNGDLSLIRRVPAAITDEFVAEARAVARRSGKKKQEEEEEDDDDDDDDNDLDDGDVAQQTAAAKAPLTTDDCVRLFGVAMSDLHKKSAAIRTALADRDRDVIAHDVGTKTVSVATKLATYDASITECPSHSEFLAVHDVARRNDAQRARGEIVDPHDTAGRSVTLSHAQARQANGGDVAHFIGCTLPNALLLSRNVDTALPRDDSGVAHKLNYYNKQTDIAANMPRGEHHIRRSLDALDALRLGGAAPATLVDEHRRLFLVKGEGAIPLQPRSSPSAAAVATAAASSAASTESVVVRVLAVDQSYRSTLEKNSNAHTPLYNELVEKCVELFTALLGQPCRVEFHYTNARPTTILTQHDSPTAVLDDDELPLLRSEVELNRAAFGARLPDGGWTYDVVLLAGVAARSLACDDAAMHGRRVALGLRTLPPQWCVDGEHSAVFVASNAPASVLRNAHDERDVALNAAADARVVVIGVLQALGRLDVESQRAVDLAVRAVAADTLASFPTELHVGLDAAPAKYRLRSLHDHRSAAPRCDDRTRVARHLQKLRPYELAFIRTDFSALLEDGVRAHRGLVAAHAMAVASAVAAAGGGGVPATPTAQATQLDVPPFLVNSNAVEKLLRMPKAIAKNMQHADALIEAARRGHVAADRLMRSINAVSPPPPLLDDDSDMVLDLGAAGALAELDLQRRYANEHARRDARRAVTPPSSLEDGAVPTTADDNYNNKQHKKKSKKKSKKARRAQRTRKSHHPQRRRANKPRQALHLWHSDFDRGNSAALKTTGGNSSPHKRIKRSIKMQSDHAIAQGQQPTFIQLPEHKTSRMSYMHHDRNVRPLTYDAKIVPRTKGAPVPFPVRHANGDVSPPPSRENVVMHRDVGASLNQGYEAVRFAFKLPRTDALSFDFEVEARKQYRELLGESDNDHGIALRKYFDSWLSNGRKGAKSTQSIARALFGVYTTPDAA